RDRHRVLGGNANERIVVNGVAADQDALGGREAAGVRLNAGRIRRDVVVLDLRIGGVADIDPVLVVVVDAIVYQAGPVIGVVEVDAGVGVTENLVMGDRPSLAAAVAGAVDAVLAAADAKVIERDIGRAAQLENVGAALGVAAIEVGAWAGERALNNNAAQR